MWFEQKNFHLYINRIYFLQKIFFLFRSLETLLNQKRPQYIKAKENTSHHLRKLELSKKSIKDCEEQCSKQEGDIRALQTEAADLDSAWKSFEEQTKEFLHKERGAELEASQVKKPARRKSVLIVSVYPFSQKV